MRPWLGNLILFVFASLFSVCGSYLHEALDVRARGTVLAEDMARYATAPCVEPRASAPQVDQLLTRTARYRPFVACTFVVDGMPHEATSEFTLIDHYRSAYNALLEAQRWVAAHTPLVAYYDPLLPGHSTLSRDVEYNVTAETVLSIAGLVLALVLWFLIVRKAYLWVRERRRRKPDEPIPGARVV